MFQVNSVFLPKTNCSGNFLLTLFPLVIPQAALLYEPSWQLILAEYLSPYRENSVISETLLWKSSRFKSAGKATKLGKLPPLNCSSCAELGIFNQHNNKIKERKQIRDLPWKRSGRESPCHMEKLPLQHVWFSANKHFPDNCYSTPEELGLLIRDVNLLNPPHFSSLAAICDSINARGPPCFSCAHIPKYAPQDLCGQWENE